MVQRLSIAVIAKSRGNAARMLEALHQHSADGSHVASRDGLQDILKDSGGPDGAFVDVAGFGRDVWEMCEDLRRHDVAFFLISGANLGQAQDVGLRHGARATVGKPISMKLFAQLLQQLADQGRGDNPSQSEP